MRSAKGRQMSTNRAPAEFRGAGAGGPVPFTDSDDINEDEYRRHVRFMVDGGVSMLMPAPMVGSGVQLSRQEWIRVVQLTVEEAKGQAGVFPMCYVPAGTKNTIRVISELAEIGADGAYLPSPILWQSGREAMFAHYGGILEQTALPIILYSCPDTTGSEITRDVVARLLDEYPGRILGLKQHRMSELFFDIQLLGDRINFAPACFDRYTLAGLRLGCRAQVTIGGALLPEVVSGLFAKWESGDKGGATELFEKYLPFFNIPPIEIFASHRDYYAGTYYYILKRLGFEFGKPRLPYLWPIPDDFQRLIDEVMDSLEIGKA